nr:hypothetical protein GCM10020093_036720 [Planobispora longispora]
MTRSSAFGNIDPETFSRRASSFGGQAAAYARERPGYPDAAVRWALEPVSGRTPPRVLDLGAGTGKLTESLVRLGADVVAVEPDPAMLAQFRSALPEVGALPGTAEEIPCRTAPSTPSWSGRRCTGSTSTGRCRRSAGSSARAACWAGCGTSTTTGSPGSGG